jgi:soluble lytic murein transglycosylase-like protein
MLRYLVLSSCLAASALAGEYAVLASGSRLHIDRHETDGAKVRLFNGAGFTELSAADVRSFEAEEAVPQPVLQPAPPVPPLAAPVAPPVLSFADMADRAADKYGLPRNLVRSVISAESCFQPRAVSPKGAIGLMQLMPGTARQLGADPNDPAQNVDAGTRYLRDLLEKYDGALWHALAAYNAGPGAVDKYKGVPPYLETIRYVKKVVRSWQRE